MLFDTHTHVQIDRFDKDREAVLTRAREAGVTQMMCIGFDPATCEGAVELAAEHAGIYASVGLHPHEAKRMDEALLERLRSWAARPEVVALGEMGLDFYHDLSPHELQHRAFEAQLDLAAELGLPVVIHNREAYHEILPVLERYNGRVRGIMHCFSGDWEIAQRCMDIGYLISVAGPVTYPKADQVRDVARRVPLDRLLVETDCPWLPPQFRRGKRNEPAYVRATTERVAQLRELSIEELAAATTANAEAIFQIRPSGS